MAVGVIRKLLRAFEGQARKIAREAEEALTESEKRETLQFLREEADGAVAQAKASVPGNPDPAATAQAQTASAGSGNPGAGKPAKPLDPKQKASFASDVLDSTSPAHFDDVATLQRAQTNVRRGLEDAGIVGKVDDLKVKDKGTGKKRDATPDEIAATMRAGGTVSHNDYNRLAEARQTELRARLEKDRLIEGMSPEGRDALALRQLGGNGHHSTQHHGSHATGGQGHSSRTDASPATAGPSVFAPGLTGRDLARGEGIRLAGDALRRSPRLASVLSWGSLLLGGAYGLYYAGGKGLEVWEINRADAAPGSFMWGSTVHYTQGYNGRANDGSAFQENVEIGRKNLNPGKYISQYETQVSGGWAPPPGAVLAYNEAVDNQKKALETSNRVKRTRTAEATSEIDGAVHTKGQISVSAAVNYITGIEVPWVSDVEPVLKKQFDLYAPSGKVTANQIQSILERPEVGKEISQKVARDDGKINALYDRADELIKRLDRVMGPAPVMQ